MKLKGLAALMLAVTLGQASATTQPFNTYNFAGLKWLTNRSETKKLMVSKGYKYLGLCKEVYSNCTKYEENDQVYSGEVLENKADIDAYFNQEGSLVAIAVYIETDKGELIGRYRGAVEILKKKYGKPYESVEEYDKPYSSSSLSEALEIGKANIYTSWYTKDDSQGRYEGLNISLSRELYLAIDYDSQFWDAEYDRRTKSGGDDL